MNVLMICTGNYSDLGGDLKDTLTKDCVAEQNDFRYVYAVNGRNSSSGNMNADGFTQNLDLGESAAVQIFRRRLEGY